MKRDDDDVFEDGPLAGMRVDTLAKASVGSLWAASAWIVGALVYWLLVRP